MPLKRRHEESEGQYSEDDNSFSNEDYSDIDISSALTSKKPRIEEDEEDEDEGLATFLQDSIAKRNVRDGTETVKKVKGKTKLTKGEVGGGSFQSMGLHPSLLRSLMFQGYRTPTPIQRLSIPALLSNPPRDLVGMARTGSGKSLAYMIPLVQRLGGRHSTTFGARALILLPTRELALQILKVGKELTRGWDHDKGAHAGDQKESGDSKGTSVRWSLIVGGEGLDEQFEMMSNNPDVIIATPGRLLHLAVEMNLDLKSVQYVVFDEADRLFEMGFETALNEILARLASSRQTLLFSATLPKSLVEFAKAGLQNPKLVRLDAESKLSSDLKMAFFSVKKVEKDACLLALLRDVIKVPIAGSDKSTEADKKGKGKGKGKARDTTTMPHQTLVFAATKHHVEYLMNLLTTAGYAVSHIYGSLDQSARTYQMEQFRRGYTTILVVTDVAARGIDIPVLENVVNYDFPHGARVFVHRVGRTARAGRQGWAWSFVTNSELPYLLDLQLFLGRPLNCSVEETGDNSYTGSLILGPFERTKVDEDVEYIRSLDDVNHSLPSLRDVMKRGHTKYERSKGKASPPSYKRAKEMMKDPRWILAGSDTGVHPVLLRGSDESERHTQELARRSLLKTINSFKPAETVFEIGAKGKAGTANAALMKQRRKALDKTIQRSLPATSAAISDDDAPSQGGDQQEMEMADEEEIAEVFNNPGGRKRDFRDSDFYMSHYQKDAVSEKGYSLTDGASFIEQARGATFDLAGDEAVASRQRHQLGWDKKKKKFIKGDGVGADNVKLVKTENGVRLPASYRSGRFEEWKSKTRVRLPRVGEEEGPGARNVARGQNYRHDKVTAAKPLDPLRSDYERKLRHTRKDSLSKPKKYLKFTGGAKSRFGGKSTGRVKSELKNAEQIRKSRKIQENRKLKNARPNRKGKR